MKNILFFLILSSSLINSCRKPKEAPSLKSVITVGEWYVNLMRDNGINKTASYQGWKFTFQADKVVKVTNGVSNYTGVWDEDVLKQKFILTINSPLQPLIFISQEWDISFKTPNRVTFKDNDLNPSQELQFTRF
jgi:hypothetical protein